MAVRPASSPFHPFERYAAAHQRVSDHLRVDQRRAVRRRHRARRRLGPTLDTSRHRRPPTGRSVPCDIPGMARSPNRSSHTAVYWPLRSTHHRGVPPHPRHEDEPECAEPSRIPTRTPRGNTGCSGGLAGPSRRQSALLGPVPACTTRTALRSPTTSLAPAGRAGRRLRLGLARRGPLRWPGAAFLWSAILSDLVLASQKSGRRPLISAFARTAGRAACPRRSGLRIQQRPNQLRPFTAQPAPEAHQFRVQ